MKRPDDKPSGDLWLGVSAGSETRAEREPESRAEGVTRAERGSWIDRNWPAPIVDAFRGSQRKPTLILLVSSPLLLVWIYCFQPAALARYLFAGLAEEQAAIAGAFCQMLSSLLLLGVVPALMVKWIFRERWADYGLRLGVVQETLGSFLILGPLFVVGGYVASRDPGIMAKFPLNPHAGRSAAMFAAHAVAQMSFYVGWEFFFRGFMLQGLRPSMGNANAVLIQVLASSLAHIGSPASETFGAILGGLLWGVLAIRTRSILSGWGQHYLLGLSLDAFLCFG